MLHLRPGIETAKGSDMLVDSAGNAVRGIRLMSQMPMFYQSKGWRRLPITRPGSKVLSFCERASPIWKPARRNSGDSLTASTRCSMASRKPARTVSIVLSDQWRPSYSQISGRPKNTSRTAVSLSPAPAAKRAPCSWKTSPCAANMEHFKPWERGRPRLSARRARRRVLAHAKWNAGHVTLTHDCCASPIFRYAWPTPSSGSTSERTPLSRHSGSYRTIKGGCSGESLSTSQKR